MSVSFKEAMHAQRHVLGAIMLRNIKTRFFGNGFGFIVAILWPVIHIVLILLIFSGAGRISPFGDSLILFLATGTIPFMTFSYLSRFTMMALLATKPLLAFPEIKVIDVLIASAILEALAACLVVIVMLALGWFYEIDFIPRDPQQAFYAFLASLLLGFGMGIFNGLIGMAFPLWVTGYVLVTIFLWVISGVAFVASALPEPIRSWLAYNPVLQLIEWMRAAYYEGYSEELLSRPYVLIIGAAALVIGLAAERVLRGAILMER